VCSSFEEKEEEVEEGEGKSMSVGWKLDWLT